MTRLPIDCTDDFANTIPAALTAAGIDPTGKYLSVIVWEDDETGTLIVSDGDEEINATHADGSRYADRQGREDWMLVSSCDGDLDATVADLQRQLARNL